MNVGVSGHQQRVGIDWVWVAATVRAELAKLHDGQKAYSSLAAGSDQVFASVALELGLEVVAVVPLDGYERFFSGEGLSEYRRLLSRCEPVQLHHDGPSEIAFLEAGKFIADVSDVLFAVWDGAEAEGVGGTGDVVRYAHQNGRPVVHINPITRTVRAT